MALRLSAIGDGDPDRRRKAFKIFLETTLVNEFGHVLRGSTDFDSLVDQVASQMFEDPTLRAACEVAADSLLSAARTP
ncbi:hypothetical protein SAMN04489710_10970 [Paracidovorax konjaci]|uniref:Uncharacterized protein n=2 Tax=Paracidovorax konjaci TaxID=32040 RepID=A0A1I1WE02_9BURK|nr:hypothetical protein SAMN04489710_10970 [Paracidovorax konjaci]